MLPFLSHGLDGSLLLFHEFCLGFVRANYVLMCNMCVQLCETSGSSLGYGYSRMMSKPKSQPMDPSDEDQVPEGTLAI